MSSFIEIIQSAERNLNSNENNDSELNNWMILILRFAKKGKENEVIEEIDSFFSYFWHNDRLNMIS